MGPPKNINSRAKTEERSWKEHQKGNILTSHSYPQISKTWSLTQKKKKKNRCPIMASTVDWHVAWLAEN